VEGQKKTTNLSNSICFCQLQISKQFQRNTSVFSVCDTVLTGLGAGVSNFLLRHQWSATGTDRSGAQMASC